MDSRFVIIFSQGVMRVLADQIKKHRRAAGLTQSQFAEEFHVATGTIGMWETGKRQPDLDTVKKISEYFGVSADELISDGFGSACAEPELKEKERPLGLTGMSDELAELRQNHDAPTMGEMTM